MGMTGEPGSRGFSRASGRGSSGPPCPIVALFLDRPELDERPRAAPPGHRGVQQAGRAIASNLGVAAASSACFSEDTQLLAASIRGALKDPDVAYVVIQAEDGSVLADGGREAASVAGQFDKAPLRPAGFTNVERAERTVHRVRVAHRVRGGEDGRRDPDRRPARTWPGGEDDGAGDRRRDARPVARGRRAAGRAATCASGAASPSAFLILERAGPLRVLAPDHPARQPAHRAGPEDRRRPSSTSRSASSRGTRSASSPAPSTR